MCFIKIPIVKQISSLSSCLELRYFVKYQHIAVGMHIQLVAINISSNFLLPLIMCISKFTF